MELFLLMISLMWSERRLECLLLDSSLFSSFSLYCLVWKRGLYGLVFRSRERSRSSRAAGSLCGGLRASDMSGISLLISWTWGSDGVSRGSRKRVKEKTMRWWMEQASWL
ncbi:hypothetical protein Zmor_019578 [Zophobas morio]|uniref:Uncharacterized protein n=1 Tax=Zophobas morio TaxID=2755281 RepID=A0AA38I240_9CUCU|nr:hypothetical protein Zmor_019578 [Zophobas morio]